MLNIWVYSPDNLNLAMQGKEVEKILKSVLIELFILIENTYY